MDQPHCRRWTAELSADITTLDATIAGGLTPLDRLGTPADTAVVYLHSALLDRRMWHPTTRARLAARPTSHTSCLRSARPRRGGTIRRPH